MPMTRDDPMWWYIGSTIHSPLVREQSRIRKYAQLEKGTDAFFEPALRIWFAKKNFFSYFVTPIRIIDDSIQLRAQELALIKQFRPKLNHPHCNPILKRLRISLQQYVLPTSSTGLLGNKLLERYFEESQLIEPAWPFYGHDQMNFSTFYTDLAAIAETNLRFPDSYDPTQPLYLFCIFYFDIANLLMNHIVLKRRNFWSKH